MNKIIKKFLIELLIMIGIYIAFFMIVKYSSYGMFIKETLLPFMMFFIIVLYFPIFYFSEKIKILKYEFRILKTKFDIKYYREIIKDYPPAVLSLIYHGRIYYNKSLMCNILYLKNKHYIEIIDDKIYKTEECPMFYDNLGYSLYNYSLLFDDVTSVTVNKRSVMTEAGVAQAEWKQSIYNDALQAGLIQSRVKSFSLFDHFFSITAILFGFSTLFTSSGFNLFFGMIIYALIVEAFRYYALSYNKYVKTPEGCELYIKLKALKRYINNFSLLNKKSVEELQLWDDYMVYAVMLNGGSRLIGEARTLYYALHAPYQKIYSSNFVVFGLILSSITIVLTLFTEFYGIYLIAISFIMCCLGLKTPKYKLAIIGIILSSIGYILCIIEAVSLS